jgi:hypothetical protein
VKHAARSAARRLGAGAIFGAGLILGLAVAGGLVVGSLDLVRDRLKPYLSRLADEPDRVEVAAAEAPVSSPPPIDATATVVASDLSPLASQELRSVDATKVEEMSDAVDEGLAAGEFLGAVLQDEYDDVVRRDALNAILDAFGREELEPAPLTDELAIAWLSERGLAVLPVQDADFETLRKLNHPALLRLHAGEEGELRLVALLRLDGDLASLYGLTGLAPLWVPLDELVQQWEGEAWVVWHDFEQIRPVLAFGEQGHSVSWLQAALSELGYFRGTPSGLFDGATLESLQEFQRSQHLQADGMAGPRTRMVLYQLLERYEVPRLDAEDAEGAG